MNYAAIQSIRLDKHSTFAKVKYCVLDLIPSLLAFSLLLLRVSFELLVFTTLLSALLFLVSHFLKKPALPFFALGILSACLPAFGAEALFALALLFLILQELGLLSAARADSPVINQAAWCYPFLILLLIWIGVDLCFGYEIKVALNLSPKQLYNWVHFSPALVVERVFIYARWLLLAKCFTLFSRVADLRASYLKGLIFFGLPISVLILLIQMYGTELIVFPNQSPIWHELGQFGAGFSDPNAFGISAFLVLSLILGKSLAANNKQGVKFELIIAIFFLMSALYSGSRSLVLGIALLALLLFIKRYKKYALALLASLAIFLVVSVLAFGPNNLVKSDILPKIEQHMPLSLARALLAADPSRWSESFSSRAIFWSAGIAMIKDNPIIGIGPAQFRHWLPVYDRKLNLNLRGWVDNANSFYLGLLAELGVLGAIAICMALLRLNFVNRSSVEFYSLVVFALLLLFGPHLDFIEVTLLAAALFSNTLKVDKQIKDLGNQPILYTKVQASTLACFIVAFSLINLKQYFSERGFYAWEIDAAGESFRWSTQMANSRLKCEFRAGEEQRFATLKIRALNPDLSEQPLKITVSSPYAETVTKLITNHQVEQILLPCGQSSISSYKFELDRVWQPYQYMKTNDSRPLGVQVFGEM